MAVFARAHEANVLHLVVDQDVNDTWQLTVPRVQGDRLETSTVHIAKVDIDIPTGSQAARDLSAADEFPALSKAITDLPACRSAAEQMAVVLARLMRPHAGELPVLFASDLLILPVGKQLLQRLLDDATRCVRLYNQAVETTPQAGVAPLRIEPDRVELPLWLMPWQEARQRVFADLSDSKAMLTTEDGTPIDDGATLAPKALLLTAITRLACCDLFIHGKGGGKYDQAMQQWIEQWLNESLAPMVIASADVFMSFDVPVADRAAYERAVWHAHHLPHNLHRRYPEHQLSLEKQQLLDQMTAGRDKKRRAGWFRRIHQINDTLAAEHTGLIQQSRDQLASAKVGMLNRHIAAKRDWPFILYEQEQLDELVACTMDTFATHTGNKNA